MLRINATYKINDALIEAIVPYASKPVFSIVRKAKENKKCIEVHGAYGCHTVIILKNGTLILCTNVPEYYIKRLPQYQFCASAAFRGKRVKGNKAYLKQDLLLDAVKVPEGKKAPSRSVQRRIKDAKETEQFLDLTEGRKTRIYCFTITGHCYALYGADDSLSFSAGQSS